MPKRSKGTGLTRSLARRGRGKSFVHIDDQLARILSSLAHLLLKHGYGHGRLSNLAKVAFVDAARSIGPKLNSKANIARIAALTGLTRVEVSRILRGNQSALRDEGQLNRATKVAVGWQTDRAYLDKKNKPRPLKYSNSDTGFGQLVRKYSGDIPARAMLAEMLRLGLVTQSSEGLVSLIRKTPVLPSSTISTIGAIAPWVKFLANADNSLSATAMSSQTQQIKIHFDSLPEVFAASRELVDRQRSFVAGIQQLGTRPRQSGKYEVSISVAVATTRPSRPRRKKKY
jgi:hypothetical protein